MIPLNRKLRLTRHSGVLVSQNQQAEKGLTVLARVTDPDVGDWAAAPSAREVRNGTRAPGVWDWGQGKMTAAQSRQGH